MRPRQSILASRLDVELVRFNNRNHALPGIQNPVHRAVFIEQLLESIRRVEYIKVICGRDISALRACTSSDLFDPLKAAAHFHAQGDTDEAFWLVFLSVHFGKNRRTGWRLLRDVYGQLGAEHKWSWPRTSANPRAFRHWLAANQNALKTDGIPRHFGNHRKYQSLNATSSSGTGAAVESYIKWILAHQSHQGVVQEAIRAVGTSPRNVFDHLYSSMAAVASFGRTARFDYLTMVGNMGLACIEPGSTYMIGATGPFAGARLLFGGPPAPADRRQLDEWVIELESKLDVGMQVMEDALCNWQKSPAVFRPFRG